MVTTSNATQKNVWQQYIDSDYDVAVGFAIFSTVVKKFIKQNNFFRKNEN